MGVMCNYDKGRKYIEEKKERKDIEKSKERQYIKLNKESKYIEENKERKNFGKNKERKDIGKNKERKYIEENIQSNLTHPSSITKEMGFGHKPISLDFLDKSKKSICKILYKLNDKDNFGTGFFMLYKKNKYLLTCYHVINSNKLNIGIELWNKNKINLDLLNRNIIFLPDPIDITIIEINNSDIFIKDINFLFHDSNYDKGYQHCKGVDIINIGYPIGGLISAASGIIDEIKNIDFYHKIDTEPGSSGSPIILFSTSYVIGIHKGVDNDKKLNVGIFIGEALNNLGKNNIGNNIGWINGTNILPNSFRDSPVEIGGVGKLSKYQNLQQKSVTQQSKFVGGRFGKNDGTQNSIPKKVINKDNIKTNDLNKIKNEIIAIYNKQTDEIDLLSFVPLNVNENNCEIYVNNRIN